MKTTVAINIKTTREARMMFKHACERNRTSMNQEVNRFMRKYISLNKLDTPVVKKQ